jgi:hypothetical protein
MQADLSDARYHVLERNHFGDAGKPGAGKLARRVWRGAFGKGQQCTSPDAYPTYLLQPTLHKFCAPNVMAAWLPTL